jgi:hypothetical protein
VFIIIALWIADVHHGDHNVIKRDLVQVDKNGKPDEKPALPHEHDIKQASASTHDHSNSSHAAIGTQSKDD